MEEKKTTDNYESAIGNNKSQNNKNKFDKKCFKDKSTIKCDVCERLGHYANEYRTSEYKLPTFRNPNSGQGTSTEIKREYLSTFYKYCKTPNHDISECRKFKYNEKMKFEERFKESNQNTEIKKYNREIII